jgi:hypothetical protein
MVESIPAVTADWNLSSVGNVLSTKIHSSLY